MDKATAIRCVKQYADLVRQNFDVRKIAPMHCTGLVAVNLIKSEFENNFIGLTEGCSIEIKDFNIGDCEETGYSTRQK